MNSLDPKPPYAKVLQTVEKPDKSGLPGVSLATFHCLQGDTEDT